MKSRTYSIEEIVNESVSFSHILTHGNDYLIAELVNNNALTGATDTTFHFDGLVFLYCSRGEYAIDRTIDEVKLKARNFMVIYPDDNIRSVVKTSSDPGLITGLFLTRAFIRDLNFNLNVFNFLDPMGAKKMVISLSKTDCDIFTQYFNLLRMNALNRIAHQTDVFTRNIARNITAALFYNLMLLTRDNTRVSMGKTPTSHKVNFVVDFMELLQNHYKKERTVKYYASRLCITPKYLSLLIKELTGRSASNWIDECVILEAKNLLRFSGLNVQQVAYELNFSNQSAFGKYFKHLTGMSPTSFQNS